MQERRAPPADFSALEQLGSRAEAPLSCAATAARTRSRVRSARAEGHNGVSASPQDVEPARVTGTRRCRRRRVNDHLVTGREPRARGGGQGCSVAHAPRLSVERALLE